MDTAPQQPDGMPYGHLETMLKETLDLAKDTNKRVKRMERNALIGFIAKVVLWLLLLGVPLFFISSYLGPLMNTFSGGQGKMAPTGILGFPSADQLKQILNTYNPNAQ